MNRISYFSSGTTLADEPAAKPRAVINDGNITAINDGNIDASAVQLLKKIFGGEPVKFHNSVCVCFVLRHLAS